MHVWRRSAAAAIAATGLSVILPAQEAKVARPAALGVQANIVFRGFLDHPQNSALLRALGKR